MSTYNYPTSEESWARWRRDHRKHNVVVTGAWWLQCATCGQPYMIPGHDGRHAVDVLREDFGRVD